LYQQFLRGTGFRGATTYGDPEASRALLESGSGPAPDIHRALTGKTALDDLQRITSFSTRVERLTRASRLRNPG